MNQFKNFFLQKIISAKKPDWKSGKKLKVVVEVSRYFTKKQWEIIISGFEITETTDWDIVYCKNNIEVYRHFADANICFIFGISNFLLNQVNKPMMVYFPVLGLDFLNNKTIPFNLTIEQPPPLSAQSIAEYCIAMSIILTRNLHKSFENSFINKWKQSNIIPGSAKSITQCKIGILGLGRVGKVVAKNFNAIGCTVIGCDIVIPNDIDSLSLFFFADKLYDFIKGIDILIVALPLNEYTKNLIDSNIIKALGKNKYIINISRGEIINEAALMQALSSNNLKGAALDVFQHEPLSSSSAFYRTNNIILTPHIAGNINLFVNEISNDFIQKAIVYSKSILNSEKR